MLASSVRWRERKGLTNIRKNAVYVTQGRQSLPSAELAEGGVLPQGGAARPHFDRAILWSGTVWVVSFVLEVKSNQPRKQDQP